ncbi:MAG TPA: hypothetical protein VN577_20470 [Terriglobales bacterium]|nr:hypothetical protein [Terriglobales bacterium]
MIEELATSPERTEDITSYVDGVDIVVNAAYTETDFSKNRLRQRQQKEAKVRFEIAVDSVTVTSPATSKGRDLVKAVINRLEERRKAVLNVEEVDLSGIRDSFLRTLFFTKLCSGLPNATLNDVVRVKLQSTNKGTSDGDEADEEDEEEDINLDIGVTKTEEVVAGVLRAAALNGQDLFGTSVFQELREKGFYLTSVTWRSRLQEPGNPIVEFNADFEDSENCRMFTYTANTWKIRRTTGEYNESFTSIPADKKADLLKMLHRFALSTMHEVAKEQASSSQSPAKANGGDSEPN